MGAVFSPDGYSLPHFRHRHFSRNKMLLALRKLHIESHLVVSTEAGSNLQRMGMQDVPVHNLADNIHSEAEFDAGMVREGI